MCGVTIDIEGALDASGVSPIQTFKLVKVFDLAIAPPELQDLAELQILRQTSIDDETNAENFGSEEKPPQPFPRQTTRMQMS